MSEAEGDQCHAASGAHLRELLRGNHRYVFTLIHKFQTPELLCDRPDVIVLTDEAHRSQYDTLALNMRAALPKALFLAFTGTPLIAGEERTKDVFGDYVSIQARVQRAIHSVCGALAALIRNMMGCFDHREDIPFGLLFCPVLGCRSHEPPIVFCGIASSIDWSALARSLSWSSRLMASDGSVLVIFSLLFSTARGRDEGLAGVTFFQVDQKSHSDIRSPEASPGSAASGHYRAA